MEYSTKISDFTEIHDADNELPEKSGKYIFVSCNHKGIPIYADIVNYSAKHHLWNVLDWQEREEAERSAFKNLERCYWKKSLYIEQEKEETG